MDDLTPLEQAYWQKLYDLFQRVSPQQPEKGIRALLKRARHRVAAEGILPEQALAEMFAEAEARTCRRMALLNACKLRRNGEAD